MQIHPKLLVREKSEKRIPRAQHTNNVQEHKVSETAQGTLNLARGTV